MSGQRSSTGGISRVPYLPGLDGLRALAVLVVIVYHANHRWLEGGYLGVEVFFVISGYLITLLLLGEHERNRRIDLQGFWLRRARRLLPALFVTLIGVAVYVAAFYPETREQSRGDIVAALFYVSNWYQVLVGQGYGAGELFVPLRHLWSLAVEEQFYLVWPMVMAAMLRRRRYLPDLARQFFGAAILISIATAVLYRPGVVVACGGENTNGLWTVAGRCINVNEFLYLGSFSRATGLLLGAGFALVWRPAAIMRGPMRDMARRLDLVAFLALAGLGVLTVKMHLIKSGVYNAWLFRGGFFLTGILTLLVIAAATHQQGLTGPVLGNPVMRWIGTRSYGLYLFHWPIFQMMRSAANVPLSVTQLVVGVSVTAVVAELSFRAIETPIREGRLGDVMGVLRRNGPNVVASATVASVILLAAGSLVVADPHCVGAQNCAQEENAGSQDGGSTVPGETTTTSLPPEPIPYIAVGESVMVGAANTLRSAGVYTDASENRGPNGIREAIVGLRDNLRLLGEGSSVAIQVGTNAPLSRESLDAIMAEIPPGVKGVYFLTVYADLAYIAANNELIMSLPETYPSVRVLSWDLAAPTAFLCADGIHISCNGEYPQIVYSNLILGAFGIPTLALPAAPTTTTTSTTTIPGAEIPVITKPQATTTTGQSAPTT